MVLHALETAAGVRFFQPHTLGTIAGLHELRRSPVSYDVILVGASPLWGLDTRQMEAQAAGQGLSGLRVTLLAVPGLTAPALHVTVRDGLPPQPPRLLVLEVNPRTLNSASTTMHLYFHHYGGPLDSLRGGPLPESPREALAWFRGLLRPAEIAWQGVRAALSTTASRAEGRPAPVATPSNAEAWGRHLERARLEMQDFRITGRADRSFQATLDLLRRRQVRVLVLNTAASADATAVYETHGYRDYLAYVQRMCAERGIPFADINTAQDRPAPELWNDPDHLSREGGRWLTRLVTERFIVPALRTPERREVRSTPADPGGR